MYLKRRHFRSKTSFYVHFTLLCAFLMQILIRQTKFRTKLEGFYYAFPSSLEFTVSDSNFLDTNFNYSNCKFCNYPIRNQEFANSESKDLILTISMSKATQISVFARTLRTVNSNCSCVILLDDKAFHSLDHITLESVRDCGAQIINFGKYIYPPKTEVMFRFHIMNEFLRVNQDKINRVIMCDLFDTAFQGDPFNIQINTYSLNLADEGKPYWHHWTVANQKWINMYNSSYPLKRDLGFNYFCAAYIGGPIDQILSFLDLFLTYFSIDVPGNDQGCLNYLFLSGVLQKMALPVNKHRKKELVHHTFFSQFTSDYTFGFIPSIRNKSFYASVIHHTYGFRNMKYTLLKSCPRLNKCMKNYIRGISDNDVEKFEIKEHILI